MAIGTYAVERDYSHYVAYASNTVLAIVGVATKGPVGVATACTSAQDLVNKFGPLRVDCYGLYAGQYFLSQASKIYYVRAASESAKAAVTLVEGSGASNTIADALSLQLLEVGTYGNGYQITVTVIDEEHYDLVLKDAKENTLESIKNVSFEELVKDYTTSYFKISANSTSAIKLTAGTYTFNNGNDGIEDITSADYITAGEALKNQSVDINLLSVPGVSDAEVVIAFLALAEERGDCLYLVDPPAGLTKEGVAQWHNGEGSYQHDAFNSSYGALYYDWVTIYDSINKLKVQVPPSVPVAASIAYSDRVSELWYAPAGLTRGVLRGVLTTDSQLSKRDVETLYSGDNNINSIYDDPQVGLVIWGQKTLSRSDTALNRVNVRRLVNYIKKVVTAACEYLTFEPNDRLTWNSFEMKVVPLLETIKNGRGIYEYRVVKGETIVSSQDIDNYRMPCMVMIRPTKAAEMIPIYFVITSTGADFNEVLEENGVAILD